MPSRERPHPQDEPVIGINYPGYDEPEPVDNGFEANEPHIGAPEPETDDAPIGADEEWIDEYEDPYDDYYYDDEYYESTPARQPLFYIIIGLAVVLGALLVFLVFQFVGGNGEPAPVDPTFNVTIDEPRENDRVNIDSDIDVRIRANATEPIVRLQLHVDGEMVDEEQFLEEPPDGIYSATLQFRPSETRNYTLTAHAISESGASAESEPVTVVAVEAIDDPPETITGQVITNVNAREGPGDEYEAVRTLTSGETVTIVGRSADSEWLLLDDGTWVRRAAIQPSESIELLPVREPTPEPEPTPTPEEEETPTPTPVVDAPDFMPTNATLDGNGSILRVTVANLSSTGYEGPLVVRVTGFERGPIEQVFGVNIPGNSAAAVEFNLSPAHTDGATIQAIVDPDGAIEELSDDNNTATFVLAPPVEPPVIVIASASEQNGNVQVVIQNTGGQLESSEVTVRVEINGTSTERRETIALAKDQTHSFSVPAPGTGQAEVKVYVGNQQVDSAAITIGTESSFAPAN